MSFRFALGAALAPWGYVQESDLHALRAVPVGELRGTRADMHRQRRAAAVLVPHMAGEQAGAAVLRGNEVIQ